MSVAEPPCTTVAGPVIDTVGAAVTVMFTEANAPVHPLASLDVTLYNVVVDGLTTLLEPRPKPLSHE